MCFERRKLKCMAWHVRTQRTRTCTYARNHIYERHIILLRQVVLLFYAAMYSTAGNTPNEIACETLNRVLATTMCLRFSFVFESVLE